MNMKFLGLTAVLAGAVLIVAFQQSPEGPVSKYADSLHQGKSLTAVLQIADSSQGSIKTTIAYSKDSMFKIDNDRVLIVSDGKTLWKLDKKANTYTVEDASLAPIGEDPYLEFAGFFKKRVFSRVKNIESGGSRSIGGVTADSWKISLPEDKVLNLFLNPTNGLAAGEQVTSGSKTLTVIVKSAKLSDAALPADQFNFVPPAGAKQAALPTDWAAVSTIFQDNCMPCHSAAGHRAGVDLSSYDSVMQNQGLIVPGKPEDSRLYLYVDGSRDPRMPMGRAPLTNSNIKIIHDWIQNGAKGPAK